MPALTPSLVDRIGEAAERSLAPGQVPGLGIGVLLDAEPAWAGGFGMADAARSIAFTGDTPFRIASITKTVTATAVLQLRDEGRLHLDDPLVRHLPEASAIRQPFGPPDGVTVRRLLLHTAGVQADAPVTDPASLPGLRLTELLARLAEVRLVRPPDAGWHYSNVGYELLVALVERLTGRRWPDHLRDAMLVPAGLRDTGYAPPAGRSPAVGTLPTLGASTPGPPPATDPATMLGAGGLWSTAADVTRWLAVQSRTDDGDRRGAGGRVLDGRTLREMQRPAVPVDPAWRLAQGMGWAMERIGGRIWLRHTGSLPGCRAMAMFRPGDGVGVVVLANGSVRPNALAATIGGWLLAASPRRRTSRGRPSPSRVEAAVDPAARAAASGLAGRFVDRAYGRVVEVAVDGPAPTIRERTAGGTSIPSPLVPTDDPLTWSVGGDGDLQGEAVRFVRDGDGRVELANVAGTPFHRRALRDGAVRPRTGPTGGGPGTIDAMHPPTEPT